MSISASRTTRFGIGGGVAIPAGDFSAKINDTNISAATDALVVAEKKADIDREIINSVDALVLTPHNADISSFFSFDNTAFDTNAFDINAWALEVDGDVAVVMLHNTHILHRGITALAIEAHSY